MTCDLRIKYDEVLKGRAAELFADGHGHTSVALLSSIVHGGESLLPCGLPDGLRATGDGRRHGGRKVCVCLVSRTRRRARNLLYRSGDSSCARLPMLRFG